MQQNEKGWVFTKWWSAAISFECCDHCGITFLCPWATGTVVTPSFCIPLEPVGTSDHLLSSGDCCMCSLKDCSVTVSCKPRNNYYLQYFRWQNMWTSVVKLLPTSFQSTSTETKRGCKLALEESDFVLRYSLKFRDKWLGRLTAVEYFQFSISITTFACWGLPISKSQGQCSLVYFGDRAGVDEEITVHGCS